MLSGHDVEDPTLRVAIGRRRIERVETSENRITRMKHHPTTRTGQERFRIRCLGRTTGMPELRLCRQ